jgi:hypothetical protein
MAKLLAAALVKMKMARMFASLAALERISNDYIYRSSFKDEICN